jgi:hypothetical protein
MAKKRHIVTKAASARWFRGADVPMRVIRDFARQVGKRFQPEKIILFGSYAYGTPHADSDVDILVVMPCLNQHSQALSPQHRARPVPDGPPRRQAAPSRLEIVRARVVPDRDHEQRENPL